MLCLLNSYGRSRADPGQYIVQFLYGFHFSRTRTIRTDSAEAYIIFNLSQYSFRDRFLLVEGRDRKSGSLQALWAANRKRVGQSNRKSATTNKAGNMRMAAEFLIQLGIFATRARQVSAIRILYFKAPAFHKHLIRFYHNNVHFNVHQDVRCVNFFE